MKQGKRVESDLNPDPLTSFLTDFLEQSRLNEVNDADIFYLGVERKTKIENEPLILTTM